MRLEQEARHHAEVAAAATQRPEEIGVLILAGGDKAAVGEDHIGFEQVVDREPVLAREIPRAAAQGQARDAGARDDAERDREAERVSRMIDVARRAARFDPHGLRGRIYANTFHLGQVDDESIVAAAQARAAVATAADRDEQGHARARSSRPRSRQRHPRSAQSAAGLLVDHAVVELARLIVAVVAWLNELAAK